MKKDLLFWDVDTQFDFMNSQGNLYVPGAEEIIDKVSETRRLALDNGFSMLGDIDWHSRQNAEISDSPDFKQTFPPHCMAGSPGAERVGYLGKVRIEYVEIDKTPQDALKKLVDKEQFHVVIKKNSLDVFDNPTADAIVELLRPGQVVVFGVALDFCVYCALRGLLKHKVTRPAVLKDVTKGLGERPEQEIFDELSDMGVEIIELADLKRQLQCG